MKRKLFFIAVIVICLSLMVYGTMAYFNAEETAHNVITTGDVDIALLEWADKNKTEPFPKNGIPGVMPDTSVTKIVEIENTGLGAAWVRVKVDKAIDLVSNADWVDLKLITIDFNEDDWTSGTDGYWYYNNPLEPGKTTEPLFTTVSFDKTMGNDYQNATATVTVSAQAVQSANNGASYTEADGWPTT